MGFSATYDLRKSETRPLPSAANLDCFACFLLVADAAADAADAAAVVRDAQALYYPLDYCFLGDPDHASDAP